MNVREAGERFPWYETPFWDDVCAQARQTAEEEGDEVARAGVYFELHVHQMPGLLAPFLVTALRRAPATPDDWLSLRPGVETSALAIEASAPLASLGYADQV